MGAILDRAVIPFLESVGLPYRQDGDVLVIVFSHNDFRHELLVAETVEDLIVSIGEAVCGPKENQQGLYDIANQLNHQGPGKYIVSNAGKIMFYYL